MGNCRFVFRRKVTMKIRNQTSRETAAPVSRETTEAARLALLALAQAEIKGTSTLELRAATADALVAAGVGTPWSHCEILNGFWPPRRLIEAAMACAIVKVCSCGIVISGAEWTRLRYLGVQDVGDGERLELRLCHCGSSVAVEIPRARVA